MGIEIRRHFVVNVERKGSASLRLRKPLGRLTRGVGREGKFCAPTLVPKRPTSQCDQGAHTRTSTMKQHSERSTSPRQVSGQHEQFKHIWEKMSHICSVSLPTALVELYIACVSQPGIGHSHLARRKKLGETRFDKPLISTTNLTFGECSYHVFTAPLDAEDTPRLPAQKQPDTVHQVSIALGARTR